MRKDKLTTDMIRKTRKLAQLIKPTLKPIKIKGKEYFIYHIPSGKLMGINEIPLAYPPLFKPKKDGTPDKRRNPYRKMEQARKDIDAISGINERLIGLR